MDDYWLTHMTYSEVPEDVPTLEGHGSRAMRTGVQRLLCLLRRIRRWF